MHRAVLRFYAELNDFLPPRLRQTAFVHEFRFSPSVKDIIEGLGVPHTEVDLVLVNGRSVGFDCQVEDGDRVSVYPVFEAFDIGSLVRVRPQPLREPRFVLDVHLGRLARYLRMLGLDAAWPGDTADDHLVSISRQEKRIILTRDRGLLKRGAVTHGYVVRSAEPVEQLMEVVTRFHLSGSLRPLSRCLLCNVHLRQATDAEVEAKAPPRVRESFAAFHLCPECGRLYWQGSHYDAMMRLAEAVAGGSAMPQGEGVADGSSQEP